MNQRTVRSSEGYLWRGFLVWLLIAVAEALHGTLRTLFLTPLLGDLPSRQLGVLTGSLIILAIASLSVLWIGAVTTRQWLAVGLMWVVLMVAFEIGLGRLLGLSWERLASDYDPRQGGYMLAGLAVLALAPLAAAKLRINADG